MGKASQKEIDRLDEILSRMRATEPSSQERATAVSKPLRREGRSPYWGVLKPPSPPVATREAEAPGLWKNITDPLGRWIGPWVEETAAPWIGPKIEAVAPSIARGWQGVEQAALSMGPSGQLITHVPEIFRGAELADRFLGLGIGLAGGVAQWAPWQPDRDPDRGPRTFEPPRVETYPGAAKAFLEGVRQEGDIEDWFERGSVAAQNVMDAGWGFWGASELVGAALGPLGLAKGGALLERASAPLARTVARPIARVAPRAAPPIERGTAAGLVEAGKILRAPLELEEELGRVIAAQFKRFRRPAEEAAEEVPLGMVPDDVVDADDIIGPPPTAARISDQYVGTELTQENVDEIYERMLDEMAAGPRPDEGIELTQENVDEIYERMLDQMAGTPAFPPPTIAARGAPAARAVGEEPVSLAGTYDAFKANNAPRISYVTPRGEDAWRYSDEAYKADAGYMVRSDDTNRGLRWVFRLSDGRQVSLQGYLKATHPELVGKVTRGAKALQGVWRNLSHEEKLTLVDSIPWEDAVPLTRTYPETGRGNAFGVLEQWLRVNKHPLAEVPSADNYLAQTLESHLRGRRPTPTASNKVFHGTRHPNPESFIDDNGNLVLRASENFEGKTVGVSFSESQETALDYATRIPGTGPARVRAQGAVFEIDADAIPSERLFVESGEEIATRGAESVIIPKGKFRIIQDVAARTELEQWEAQQIARVKRLSDPELADEWDAAMIAGEVGEFNRVFEDPFAHIGSGVNTDIVAKYGPVMPDSFPVWDEILRRVANSSDPEGTIARIVSGIPETPQGPVGFSRDLLAADIRKDIADPTWRDKFMYRGPAARNVDDLVDDLARERDALEEKLYEIQVEKEVWKETTLPKPPRFGTRERAEYDALRMQRSEAGIPIRTKKAQIDEVWAEEQRLKQEIERIDGELDAARAVPDEGMAGEAIPPIPRPRHPGIDLDEVPDGTLVGSSEPRVIRDAPLNTVVPDNAAGDIVSGADPSPPKSIFDATPEQAFKELASLATPLEMAAMAPSQWKTLLRKLDPTGRMAAAKARPLQIIRTIMRRHEAAINSAQAEASRIIRGGLRDTDRGESWLRELGLSVSRGGREVIRNSAIPEIDQLYKALHTGQRGLVPERLRGLYDELRHLADFEEAARIDFDPDMATVQDYFYRGWKPSEALLADQASAQIGGAPKFKRPRRDASYQVMRDAGYEPLSWNPFEQWRISRMQGVKYRQQMSLVTQLKKVGLWRPSAGATKEGVEGIVDLPLSTRRGPFKKIWRTPKIGPAFEGKPITIVDDVLDETGAETGEKILAEFRANRGVVHPDVATRLEAMYGKSDLGWAQVGPVDMAKVVDWLVFIPKRAKLFGSLFQQIDFLWRNLFGTSSHVVDRLLAGDIKGAVRVGLTWPKSARDIIRANLSPDYRLQLKKWLGSTEELVPGRPGITPQGIMEAGLSTRDVNIYPTDIGDIARAAADDAGVLGVKRIGRLIAQLESAMKIGLFDGVYPAAQITDIINNVAPQMARKWGHLSDEQINGAIAEFINMRYSTIPVSQSVLQNRHLRGLLQRVFFSIGESEGLLRAFTSAFTGPYAGMWRKHWLGAYIALIGVANAIHFASTKTQGEGEFLPWERWTPISEKNWGFIPFSYNRDFAAPDLPWWGRGAVQLTLDLVGQADTAFRLLDPVSFLNARESVPVRALQNQIKGSDWYGADITDAGPMGLYSRTASAINDMFAPIGIGQSTVGIAREQIPAVAAILPPGEERIGVWGQIAQAMGWNVRAETTPHLLRRIARESGEVVQLSTHPRFGQRAQEWDELTKPQQRRQLERAGTEEELARRTETGALRRAEGSVLRQRRTELEDEAAATMEKVADQYLRKPRETGEYVAEDARKEISKVLSRHYVRLENVYAELDEDEEPAENTLAHHMWRYRQIFVGFGEDGPQTSGDWEEFNEAVARFWSDIPEEDVGVVLGEMRQLEQKFPEEVRRVQEAKRYAGAFKMDINGTRYSYFDLDTIPEVENDILYKSWEELGSIDVTIEDVREYLQKSTGARSTGRTTPRGKAIDEAYKDSSSVGMLSEERETFVAQAPDEWVAAMFDAGYHFKGKGWIWENIGDALRGGAVWEQYPYGSLYEEALIANR